LQISVQLHFPAALPSKKEPLLSAEWRAGWAAELAGRFGKRHYFLIRVGNIEPLFLGFPGRILVAMSTDFRVGRRSLKK